MSDAVLITIIVTAPAITSSILAFLQQALTGRNHREAMDKLAKIEDTTNGKMDKLLKVTGAAEHAKGVIEGREKA